MKPVHCTVAQTKHDSKEWIEIFLLLQSVKFEDMRLYRKKRLTQGCNNVSLRWHEMTQQRMLIKTSLYDNPTWTMLKCPGDHTCFIQSSTNCLDVEVCNKEVDWPTQPFYKKIASRFYHLILTLQQSLWTSWVKWLVSPGPRRGTTRSPPSAAPR